MTDVSPMTELDAWVAVACEELGLRPEDVTATAVLDVARDVAHQVLRPGAPVSAYLMGVAVGRGADPSDVADRLSALALAWPSRRAGREGAGQPDGAVGEGAGQPGDAVSENAGQPRGGGERDQPGGGESELADWRGTAEWERPTPEKGDQGTRGRSIG